MAPAVATYDYVIVGAGSAGCVVASRLAADPSVRVLLVEAGGDGLRARVRAPALYPLLYRTERDHALRTDPQAGLDGRRVFVPRGRGLGGSSAINACIWHAGHPSDYDRWAALGAEGWDAASVGAALGRARIPTERARVTTALQQAFVEAASRVCGVPAGGPAAEGFAGALDLSTRRGERVSAWDAYLPEPRENVTVRLDVVVARVCFEGERATAVELVAGRDVERVRATREIVLCAGAIGSPAILMRSGVGDADALCAHGISVVHDSPGVGADLHDHLYAYLTHRAREGGARMDLLAASRAMPSALEGTPLAGNHVEVGAFVRMDAAAPAPDLQLYFTTWPAPEPNLDGRARYDDGPCFTIMPCPLQPTSRGRVRLASPSPLDAPRIDPGYMSTEEDVASFLKAFTLTRAVIADRAFDRFRGEALVPPAAAEGAALVRAIRGRAGSVHHAVGTCRMGEDPRAVVDPSLRVRGVTALRVIDASVMPRITSGNTNAPTIAIAERGAALLAQSG